MGIWTRLRSVIDRSWPEDATVEEAQLHADRLRTDGGERRDRDESADDEENETTGTNGDGTTETDEDSGGGIDASNVEVTEAGEAEPAEPKWDRIDPDDIPEFEIRADQPPGVGESTDEASSADQHTASTADGRAAEPATDDRADDPTAGRPNTARSPGRSRIKQGGTEGYIAALEMCARLPDDVRLPDEAADLVPAAVEAELEEDIRAFAAAEFETASPSVETLSFVEVDDEIWMRLRLGISPESFADLDPDEIRTHALQQLEGLF